MKKYAALTLITLIVILLMFWLPRSQGLDRFVTVDEPKWLLRSANFYKALSERQFAYTFQREHPGVMVMWAGTAGFLRRFPGYVTLRTGQIERPNRLYYFLKNNNMSALDLLAAGRTVMVLIITIIFGLALLIMVRLIGILPAALASLLIAFDPFSVGLARLLHLDGLVSALMCLSILCFAAYLYLGRRIWYLLLSAIAAGMAWLTKSPAFFLAPFLGLWLLADWLWGIRQHKLQTPPASIRGWLASAWRQFSPMLIWFIVAAVIFVVLWPAMWMDPLGTIERVFNLASTYASEGHDSQVFFSGKVYGIGESAWYFYPVAYLWRTSPVVLIGLILALIALIWPRRLPQEPVQRKLTVVFLLFSILFTLFLSLSAKQSDRYLLPIFAPLDIIAALGWMALVEALKRASARGHIAVRWQGVGILLGAVVLVQMTGAWQSYPYFTTYYNLFLGGPRRAAEIMMIGIGEGLDQAADYLNHKPNANELKVAAWMADGPFSYFFDGRTINIEDNMNLEELKAVDYVVLYRNQRQRLLPSPEVLAYFDQFPPEHVVQIGGLDYAWIYKMGEGQGLR